MTVSITPKLSGFDTTNKATPYAGGSYTPAANKLQLAAFAWAREDGVATFDPVVSGCNLTWTKILSILDYTTGTQRRAMGLWAGLGAAPTFGAVSLGFGGVAHNLASWVISEAAGVDLSGGVAGAVVQAVPTPGSGTSLTVPLAAFAAAANAAFGCFSHQYAEDVVHGGGFGELADVPATNPAMSLQAQWRADNDTTVDWSWATSGAAAGIAVELKADATPDAPDCIIWHPDGSVVPVTIHIWTP